MSYTLIADAGSFIGLPHLQKNLPSQDYTFARTTPHGAFVVVSDGCSHGQLESNEEARKLGIVYHTDVGARLLALATAEAVQTALPQLENSPQPRALLWNSIRAAQLAVMEDAVHTLPLTHLDLMATWLCAVVLPNGRYWVLGEGDGVTARRKDDELVVNRYSWLKSPYYPAYQLGDMESFLYAYGAPETPAFKVEVSAVVEEYQEASWVVPLAKALETALGEEGILQEGEDLILCSDGIGALAKPNEAPLSEFEAVRHFAGLFKQAGPYRVRASSTIAMRRLVQQGYQATDDLSIAAVSVFAPPPITEKSNETPTGAAG